MALPLQAGNLGRLVGLPELKELSLDDTKLGAESVTQLSRMKSLKLLSVVGAGLSADEIARLKQALTGCEVRY